MSFKKHYIFHISFIVICGFFSCIPVKTVPDVRGFSIVDGNMSSKDELEKLNKYTFQVYKSPIVFNRYLEDRFENEKGFNPNNFRIKVNGEWFNFSVLSEEDSSKYLDFTDIIFKNEDPELVKSGKKKYFFAMTVTTDGYEDCLKIDSFYRYIITNYLNEIRMGFNAY